MDNKRFYSFNLVIYEDDERFDNQMFNLTTQKSTIWIKHDQDLNDEGELKKPHYHFVVKLKNACTISSLSKKLDVDEHMIEPIKKSFNGSLKYLIHYGKEDKYQYSPEEVKSNDDVLLRKFQDLVSKETPEVEKVISIQQYIENSNDYVDLGILMKYAQKVNVWDAFRRNYMIIRDLVNNHNAKINAFRYGTAYDNEYWKSVEKQENNSF